MASESLARWYAGDAGRPRFKSARQGDAVALRDTHRGLRAIEARQVSLAKLGAVRHGATRVLGAVSSVDLVRDRRGWLISFRERVAAAAPKPLDALGASEVIGLDFGVAQRWTCSTGAVEQLPTLSGARWQRLRPLDRQLAKRRRPKGEQPSRRYRVAQAERSARHQQVVNQRRELLRDLAKRLCTVASAVVVEDLAMAAMTRRARGRGRAAKAGLNRALLPQSRGLFLRALASAAQRTGTHVVRVNPAYTSQTCPACEHVAPENRESQAVFQCQRCGHAGHADVIASENIRRRGVAVLQTRAHLGPNHTGDDEPGGERGVRKTRARTRDPAEHAPPRRPA